MRYPEDHRELSDEDHLTIKVLRLYYEWHLIQAEVTNRMSFSPVLKSPISSPTHRGVAAPSYNPICIKREKWFLT